MTLSMEEVQKVARLARLELTEVEIKEQTESFNGLLQQFETLLKVDVSGIEPTSHSIRMVNVLREDVMMPSLSQDSVLANSPASREGCIIVPRILEG